MHNDGARLLRALPHTREAIATPIGVAHQTVTMWANGQRLPNREHREALERLFGIPASSWPTSIATAVAGNATGNRKRRRYQQSVPRVDVQLDATDLEAIEAIASASERSRGFVARELIREALLRRNAEARRAFERPARLVAEVTESIGLGRADHATEGSQSK